MFVMFDLLRHAYLLISVQLLLRISLDSSGLNFDSLFVVARHECQQSMGKHRQVHSGVTNECMYCR